VPVHRTRQDYEKALSDDPFDLNLRREYADFLMEEEAWDEAYKHYKLLIGKVPGTSGFYINLARSLMRLGNKADAALYYDKAEACPGFEHDLELRRELKAEGSQPPGGLRVIDGGGATALSYGGDVARIVPKQESVTFSDIVGMEDMKKAVRLKIIEPFRNPGIFARFSKKSGGGVLLYGPPGCGKTMFAKAIASECGCEFISVGISDILSHWMGESENNLAEIFNKARERRPCVLFFDELDALAFARSKSGSANTRTIVNEFLNQLDGVGKSNEGVLMLAASNMPWDVDGAMKRPGRFSRQVFIAPPDAVARAEMFRQKLSGVPAEPMDFNLLAARTERFSGADIDGLIDEAKESVIAHSLESGSERALRQEDLLSAAKRFEPSTVDWLRTAVNLVKFAGVDGSYKDVEKYLKAIGMA